ncbi:MAG: hypothetical protein LBB45_02280 [Methanobrevibacter sp.]|nr:hypothetical protein [Candidatus Methanovirga basalitermitum]
MKVYIKQRHHIIITLKEIFVNKSGVSKKKMTNEKVRTKLTIEKAVPTKLSLLTNIENKTKNQYVNELIKKSYLIIKAKCKNSLIIKDNTMNMTVNRQKKN